MKGLPFSIMLIATLLLLFTSFTTTAEVSPTPSPSTLGCDGKCEKRCANSRYKEQCLRLCGICCGKCQGCVPSTPYADKAECPCYRDMKNPKGKDKCP